jgi:hypothetical protein
MLDEDGLNGMLIEFYVLDEVILGNFKDLFVSVQYFLSIIREVVLHFPWR